MRAERQALRRERDAVAALAAAKKERKRKRIRAAKDALKKAQADLQEVIARIHREAKAAAGLRYPEPDDLDRTRSHVGPGEALVLRVCLPETQLASRV